jgi:adenylate cyclase
VALVSKRAGKTGSELNWRFQKYDRNLKDIFDLQDEITKNIVIALRVKLTEGELARIYGTGTNNLEAYLKAIKGLHHVLRSNKNDNEIGRQLYEEALKIDPNYANAYTLLAWTYRHEAVYRWVKNRAKSYKKAIELAKKALSLDEANGVPHMVISLVSAENGDYATANREAKRALALEPNNADVNFLTGLIYAWQGRDEESIEKCEKAIQLSPINNFFHSQASLRYFHVRDYENAIATAKEAIKQKQGFHEFSYLALVASYTLLGRQKEARAAAAELLKVNPKFSLARWKERYLYVSAHPKFRAHVDRLAEAARKGGLE